MSDGKYFQTTKRGEIHELKEELHANDKQKQKEVDEQAAEAAMAAALEGQTPPA